MTSNEIKVAMVIFHDYDATAGRLEILHQIVNTLGRINPGQELIR